MKNIDPVYWNECDTTCIHRPSVGGAHNTKQDESPAASEGSNIYVDLLDNILVDSTEQYKNQHTPLESAMYIITKNF